jgi:hypothetical protein
MSLGKRLILTRESSVAFFCVAQFPLWLKKALEEKQTTELHRVVHRVPQKSEYSLPQKSEYSAGKDLD